MQNEVTFTFDDIEEKHSYKPQIETAESILKSTRIKEFYNNCNYDSGLCPIIRKNSNDSYMCPKFNQGLLGAIFDAYVNHIALKIRPDDIWLSICQSFSLYVNKHSEIVRHIFVNHDGKQKIDLPIDSIPSYDDGWMHFFNDLSCLVQDNVKKDILDWMMPNFTTTTNNDKIISQISLLDSMKSYFEYGVIICCGIPRITLCGTKDDWIKLCDKISGLKKFGIWILDEWCDVLLYVVKDMMKPFDKVTDKNFWDRICKYKDGSFGYYSTPPEYRGWFIVFNPFNKQGEYILNSKQHIYNTNEFGVVSYIEGYNSLVEIKVSDGCSHHDKMLYIYSGLLSMTYDKDTNTISPSPEWIVTIK